ncbi:murein hydrolase activator EnvC family protein [Acidithiobacillus caldus]|jgi:septal ring factor EnvC (AmiA/AmiB activator)|uniref:Cell wall endopeptidase, family M23/M37 n=3 Tax=Acidithiobacillus caldus TaxID=33059 RepID=F9ZU20_ACICS|nr:peptidoglycan DD-metalloendopeptidase family protein [Acidithiobacillus caldus]AEK59316.1 Cell wall endopeptidase, family M23/M37 [Acidithiobacillus caldus SM-1]AIA56360.1 Cell wall endopeptidase, family M23/M37 [Acidithiobacillus caldus ATCC 51756]AUW33696.1 peptidoglycan DD-metalloendopeptidase family protein [Acidithiobacillus caldus]MBU2729774.1 peptidoglycan DD-metalloendopeptidase family protein [Acidithiobacillus caldus]MBU2735391.1 peptidoglycan DD-metalloendopeptidase family protei
MATHLRLRWLLGVGLVCVIPWAGAANLQQKIESSRERLQSIHSSLGALRAHVAATQKSQAEIRAEIAALDQKIQASTQKLAQIRSEQQTTRGKIDALEKRISELKNELAQQKDILAKQLRAAYTLGSVTPLAVWLQTEKPAQIGRLSVYYQALARARSELITRTEATTAAIAKQRNALKGQEQHLAELAQAVRTQEQTLEKQRQQHAKLEQQLADRIAADKAKIQELQANAQVLDGLVTRLVKEYRQQQVLAEARRKAAAAAAARAAAQRKAAEEAAARRRAEEAERARQVEREARKAQVPSPTTHVAPPQIATVPSVPSVPTPPPSAAPAVGHGPFPPPVRAPIGARFGTPRMQGGPNWQGITFSAAPGTGVSAIAPGMVLYSGPLRGYGQIVIVQQAEKVLAIYGHLGQTDVHVGQEVQTGTAIGTVGSGGELGQDGLYFEIRSGGHPVDPLRYIHN